MKRNNMMAKIPQFKWTREKLIYLCGPIDFSPDGGVSWRQELIKKLGLRK